jgi:hypothetical protein
MRRTVLSFLAVALALAGGSLLPARPAAAAGLDLKGTWKLVVCTYADDEFFLVEFGAEGGKPSAKVKSFQEFLRQVEVSKIEQKGDSVTIEFKSPFGLSPFEGKLVNQGPFAGQVLGIFRFGGSAHPARLEKTDAEKVGALSKGELVRAIQTAQADKDLKSRLDKLKKELAAHPNLGANHMVYSALVVTAVAADAKPAEVRGYVDQWLAATMPFGEEWQKETKFKALLSLGTKPAYAELALGLATELDKVFSATGTIEQQAQIVGILASVAKAAGKNDIAAKAEERAKDLEKKLDDEYLAKVPPFKPEPFAGRTNNAQDAVVLMELFTGTECPPCVAADVAFDALLQSYKPTELVGLEYHMHIPRPDPLANEDVLTRAQYYGVGSTPTTVFNGQPQAPGGGSMPMSKNKYDLYREVINAGINARRRASIDVQAKRSGDEIQITAKAQVAADEKPKEKGGEGKSEGSKLRLRLVLVEDSVRFPGGNGIRFHHHVVRAMPGGVEGVELKDGRGQSEVKVDLAEVRKTIDAYLTNFEKSFTFAKGRAPLELKDLAIVAYVQDDSDKSVLQTVLVPVHAAK